MRRLPLPADGRLPPPDEGARILVTRAAPAAENLARPVPLLRLLLSGEERYEIDGRRCRIGAGEMMLIPAGPPMRRLAGAPALGVTLELATGAGLPTLDGAVVLPLAAHAVGGWVADMAAALHRDDAATPAAAASALQDLPDRLAALVRYCRAGAGAVDAAKAVTRLDRFARVEAARAKLDAELARPVPLWELAAAARLSAFHLNRAFREIWGVAPAAYQRARRMEVAAERLRAGASAAALSRELGFATPASFSRAFVRHHGVPPGRFV